MADATVDDNAVDHLRLMYRGGATAEQMKHFLSKYISIELNSKQLDKLLREKGIIERYKIELTEEDKLYPKAFTEISEVSFQSITQDLSVQLIIPEYQRPYCWVAKQVEILLTDIIQAKKADENYYFLGYLCLMKKLNRDGSFSGKFEVVDGQQRLTTLKIIFKVLHAILRNSEESDDDDEIFANLKQWLISGKHGTEPRLIHKGSLSNTLIAELDDCDAGNSFSNAKGILELLGKPIPIARNAKNKLLSSLKDVVIKTHDILIKMDDYTKLTELTEFIGKGCRFIVNVVSDINNAVRLFRANKGVAQVLHSVEYLRAFLFNNLPHTDSRNSSFNSWEYFYECVGGTCTDMENLLTLSFRVQMLLTGNVNAIVESIGCDLTDITSPQYEYFFNRISDSTSRREKEQKATDILNLVGKVFNLKDTNITKTLEFSCKENHQDKFKYQKQLKWLYLLNKDPPFNIWEVLLLAIFIKVENEVDKDKFKKFTDLFFKTELVKIEKFVLYILMENKGFTCFSKKDSIKMAKQNFSAPMKEFLQGTVRKMHSCFRNFEGNYTPSSIKAMSFGLDDEFDKNLCEIISNSLCHPEKKNVSIALLLRLELAKRSLGEPLNIINVSSIDIATFFPLVGNIELDDTWRQKEQLRENNGKIGNLTLFSKANSNTYADYNPKTKLAFFNEPTCGLLFKLTEDFSKENIESDTWCFKKFQLVNKKRLDELSQILCLRNLSSDMKDNKNDQKPKLDEKKSGQKNQEQQREFGEDECEIKVKYKTENTPEKCGKMIPIGSTNCEICHHILFKKQSKTSVRCTKKIEKGNSEQYLPGYCKVHKKLKDRRMASKVPKNLQKEELEKKNLDDKIKDIVEKDKLEEYRKCEELDFEDCVGDVSIEELCYEFDPPRLTLLLYDEKYKSNEKDALDFFKKLLQSKCFKSLKLISETIFSQANYPTLAATIYELLSSKFLEKMEDHTEAVKTFVSVFGTKDISVMKKTFFMLSCEFDNLKVAKIAYEEYIKDYKTTFDICQQDLEGKTVLHYACNNECTLMEKWILEGSEKLGVKRKLLDLKDADGKLAKNNSKSFCGVRMVNEESVCSRSHPKSKGNCGKCHEYAGEGKKKCVNRGIYDCTWKYGDESFSAKICNKHNGARLELSKQLSTTPAGPTKTMKTTKKKREQSSQTKRTASPVVKTKKATKKLKSESSKEDIKKDSRKKECPFCGIDDTFFLGELLGPYEGSTWVHKHCLIWTPEIYMDEQTEQPVNLLDAILRGKENICSECCKEGATITCRYHGCLNVYHFGCLRKAHCYLNEEEGLVTCLEHMFCQ